MCGAFLGSSLLLCFLFGVIVVSRLTVRGSDVGNLVSLVLSEAGRHSLYSCVCFAKCHFGPYGDLGSRLTALVVFLWLMLGFRCLAMGLFLVAMLCWLEKLAHISVPFLQPD